MEKIALYICAKNQKEADGKLVQLREVCKDKKIVEEFVDIPEGAFYGRRDGLTKIKRRIKRELLDNVYVFKFEDLSRKLNTVVKLIRQFKMFKVEIISIKDKESGTDFLKGLELVFGEYEDNENFRQFNIY